MKHTRPSLQTTLHALTVKWTVAGLALSLIAGSACLFYSSRIGSETQAKTLAQSLGRAFRPEILNGNIRDSQFQIKSVLSDIPGSSAQILDDNFSETYPTPNSVPVNCKKPNGFCWNGINAVTYLHPIYFDADRKQELFGYLMLTVPTTVNLPIFLVFGSLILALFAIQAFGLTSALGQISNHILDILSTWAGHLSRNPNSKAESQLISFKEFESMETALAGLHLTIGKLEADSAKQAKEQAQVSIIREIGHDLKTPLSQVSKHFYLLTQDLKSVPEFDQGRASEIQKAFKRMGDLVRQIREFKETKVSQFATIDVTEEVKEFASSVNADPEQTAVTVEVQSDLPISVQIQKIRFYQILDNLVRNAREAITTNGKISVLLSKVGDEAVLTVEDNGSGIPTKLKNRIFDVDFTTKAGIGTGLGLGIVKRICDECQARIEITSHEGLGTQFTVSFPAINAEIETGKMKFEETVV